MIEFTVMVDRLFKYATLKTTLAILSHRTLRWSAPELFNDPFEFKNPLEFGFEWEDLPERLLEEITRLVTQPEQPDLIEGGLSTDTIRNERIAYAASRISPAQARERYRGLVASLVNVFRAPDSYYDQYWRQKRREWRVLCLSAVENNILMWSHYAQSHQGVVLGFEPHAGSASELTVARAVSYSKQVNTAASLEEFVGFLTSQRPKPDNKGAFERAVYTKSIDWAYEQEWRAMTKDFTTPQLFSDRSFDPRELVAIYFGCRTPEQCKSKIIEAAMGLETPISFFQMRDERIRFELTPIPITP